MKLLASVLLIAVAVIAGMFAWGALQNLFSSYKDSPVATYLIIGLPALAVCVASLYLTVRIWRT